MHVAHLALADFRSYDSVELAFEPGVTTFVGDNGQGKTNLVESLGYLTAHGSHRVATDAPLVRHGAARAIIRAAVVRGDRRALVELEINPGRANRARLNRSPVPRPRDVVGLLRTVLFAPEDLALVKGDPGERRRFLDDLLVTRAPRFAGVRADYERVLKQRNALLRSAAQLGRGRGGPPATLDVWDAHLSRCGAELLAARLELVAALRPLVAKAYAALAPSSGSADFDYRGSIEETSPDRAMLEAALLAGLENARRNELERGITLVGPHRDELALRLGELPARGYASHGESWSFALALRLAAYDLLRIDGGDPVLILDDVFAELDAERRAHLAELVGPAEQVLITAAVPADVPGSLAGARFDVGDGRVNRVR
ncbi:DNA replication/repair protein RecF [Rhizohabitans arisaemae]|uniref:DNA replication/repair protein RecF n=1 Tax=Rhizohabitans arisaemae TaxID=2720610 RepID=UPI0024B21947|nr:DNA replication/repair protein RecF [Rhizohabitans arisaemae]